MTVRKGPRRATSPALRAMRDVLNDGAVIVSGPPWSEVEAALARLPERLADSLAWRLAAALRASADAMDREWRARFEEPQRGTG